MGRAGSHIPIWVSSVVSSTGSPTLLAILASSGYLHRQASQVKSSCIAIDLRQIDNRCTCRPTVILHIIRFLLSNVNKLYSKVKGSETYKSYFPPY